MGMYSLADYAHVAGAREESPSVWPSTSRLAPPDDRPVLLLFAHPRCPCTRASLRELERLLTHHHRDIAAYIVLLDSARMEGPLWQTDLCRQAEDIFGARVIYDEDNRESERFAARTSGLTLLYDTDGTLSFAGGVTPSRGHEGANDGITALEQAIRGESIRRKQTPVFGCPVTTPYDFMKDSPQ